MIFPSNAEELSRPGTESTKSGARPLVHLLTPGDHYSPRTGSAVPTVVDGLSKVTPQGEPRPSVLVAAGTYSERYDSATAIEYRPATPRALDRYLDAGRARLGLPRYAARRSYRAALADQDDWQPSFVLAHNAVQAVPLVTRKHRPVLYAHNLLFRSYRQRETSATLRDVAAIVCVSESLVVQTEPLLPPELRNRLRVVLNGVDSAGFARLPATERNEALQVMFVGRMIREKGADLLVEAVARLGRDDIHLTLVGGSGFDANDPLTPFEREIRAAAAQLPGGADVRPFVPRSEVAATLGRADVVVVPSRWPDPCPLTVLEGMASGAAVVGARIGGIPEQMGNAGISFRPDDSSALAEILEQLANDEMLLTRIQQACRSHAVTNDWSVVHRRLVATLAEL